MALELHEVAGASAQKNVMEPSWWNWGPAAQPRKKSPHEEEEFGYVLSGALKIAIGERVVRAKDEFLFLPPGRWQ